MKLIESKTLGTAAASIEFTSIPQDGTDLVALYSIRATADTDTFNFKLNGSSSDFTQRYLRAEVGSVNSAARSDDDFVTSMPKSGFTANTFSNGSLYIPNYTSSSNKSISEDTVSENNATDGRLKINAALWSNSAAITSMTFEAFTGNFATGSTISLYKITKGSDGIVTTS
jgi:hypothetical protein